MTPRRALVALIRNEIRTLFPVWIATVFVVAARPFWDAWFSDELAVIVYFVGSLTLGAHVIGHEYGNRTLPLVLTQPVDRRRVLLVKMSVLALFLTALTAVAWFAVLREPPLGLPEASMRVAGTVWLTAFLLAPAMTMLGRSSLAGTMFSGTLPFLVGLAGVLIGLFLYGSDNAAAIDRFKIAFFWRTIPFVFALSAIAVWRLFIRLEALEGGGRDFHLFARSASTTHRPVQRRHPIGQLIVKELHLQQMVFAVLGVYLAVCAIVLVRHYFDPRVERSVLVPITFVYVPIFAMLIGSLASAEERQLGVLESQLLLPVPMWQQWLVKVGVVLGIALFFAVALPAVIMWFTGEMRHPRRIGVQEIRTFALPAIFLASGSLYVSTLVRSGIRALMTTVPFLYSAYILAWWVVRTLERTLLTEPAVQYRLGALGVELVVIVIVLLVAAVFLRFGLTNHRTTDISYVRAGRQVGWLAACVVAATTMLVFVLRGW